jgi:hypothetical protein
MLREAALIYFQMWQRTKQQKSADENQRLLLIPNILKVIIKSI